MIESPVHCKDGSFLMSTIASMNKLSVTLDFFEKEAKNDRIFLMMEYSVKRWPRVAKGYSFPIFGH